MPDDDEDYPPLPPFPVDDETLQLLAAAIPQGPTSVAALLDVLSGYDEGRVVAAHELPAPDWADLDQGMTEYKGLLYDLGVDVVPALVAEIQRLRFRATTTGHADVINDIRAPRP